MINYRKAGELPRKPHSVFRNEKDELLFEHCFTREGFDGPFSILYNEAPPQGFGDGTAVEPLFPLPEEVEGGEKEALRRRHLRSQDLKTGGTPITGRKPLAFNADIVVGTVRPDSEDAVYFSNGDGDELLYIHRGEGTLISPFGRLDFSPGDYVFVPQALAHRIELRGSDHYFLYFECTSGVHLPKQYRNPVGQLRMDAPYTHRDFRGPELVSPIDSKSIKTVISKRRNRFTKHTFPSTPMDTVGWDGTVYPFAFPILNFSPRIGQYHLPPTVHGTFATKGSLICSFVPRKVDFGEGAIPCPYPHSNVQVDEVIFYCDGDFTSRKGVSDGSVSFHPAGVPHGPQPGAYEASIGTVEAHETAVMLDTFDPLKLTSWARSVEAQEYDDSWKV